MENANLKEILEKNTKEINCLFAISCVKRIIHLYSKFEDEIILEKDEYFINFRKGTEKLFQLIDLC
jgi:hypothetical protein